MNTYVYIDIYIDAYIRAVGPQGGHHDAALWLLASGEQPLSVVLYTYIYMYTRVYIDTYAYIDIDIDEQATTLLR